MQKTAFPIGIALALTLLTATSPADFVLATHTNDVGGFINGGTDSRSVTFTQTGLTITDIEISISFSKAPLNVGENPFYNEISFSLISSVPEGPQASLIKSGTIFTGFGNPGTGTFTQGFTDAMFDGTLVFKQSATTAVNSDRFNIPTGTGPYLPDGDLSAFFTKQVDATYTLQIEEVGAGGSSLVFNSFSVKITAVPEPSSFACLGLLTTAGAFIRRRRLR